MGNLTTALSFVMILNVLMWFGQLSMIELNPDSTVYYHCEGTLLENFDKNNCVGTPELDESDLGSVLPSAEENISPETGNIFTDMFSSIKDWFSDITGLKYLYSILKAPYNILKAMHLPAEIAFGLGSIWYAVTLFLVIAFFWGRDS